MKTLKRRDPTLQLGLAGVLVTAFLVIASACTQPATSGGGGAPFMPPDGLTGPPGKDDKTRDYVKNKIHFGGILNGRVDVHFKTGQPPREVTLKVEPENSAHDVDWYSAANDTYRGGSIVARFENKDDVDVPELGLHKKKDVSYLWVGPLTANYSKKGIAFYTFDANGEVLEGPLYIIDKVVRCKDSFGYRPSAKKGIEHDPTKCAPPTSLGALAPAWRAVPQLTSYTRTHERAFAAGGLWISCSGGCCDVGAGAFY